MYKYQQIVTDISQKIDIGYYVERLPSIRQLMNTYQASQATITRALSQLVTLNLIYAQANHGYFIIPKKTTTRTIVNYDFSTKSTAYHDFPFTHYVQCLETAIKNDYATLFEYGALEGHYALRLQFQQLLIQQQIHAPITQLVITSGTQQALHLLALIMLKRQQTLLIEQPTYHLIIELAERLGIPTASFQQNMTEFNMDNFEHAVQLHRPHFVYVMPRLHNPLGTTMSLAAKQQVVALAQQYNFYIIEDDYMSDFEHTKAYQTLYELDNNERVIYLKSFSKIMFPGQRLGFAILPKALLDEFIQFKKITDVQTNMMSQAVMTSFIESGLFTYYKNKIVTNYHERALALQQALAQHMPGFTYNAHVSMHTVIELPKSTATTLLYQRFQQQHLLIDDYRLNYLSHYDNQQKFLKLNTINIPISHINDGIKQLAYIIKNVSPF